MRLVSSELYCRALGSTVVGYKRMSTITGVRPSASTDLTRDVLGQLCRRKRPTGFRFPHSHFDRGDLRSRRPSTIGCALDPRNEFDCLEIAAFAVGPAFGPADNL